ncbi:MAG: hypothetical protein QOF39_2491 [Frankiales bacterium]|nr:hypothetical protein [Frankiales bacterium]
MTDFRTFIYEVWYEYEPHGTMFDGRTLSWSAFRDLADAEEGLQRARTTKWVARAWIEAIDVTGAFEIPSKPSPRERYTARALPYPGFGWGIYHVEVLDGDRVIAEYDRNYHMLRTFEPFRQGDRDFALISPSYTRASVLDLQTGEVIATEDATPNGHGFCPVGFYVPDWWDVNGSSKLPGSSSWRPEDEWPSGDFGFVWGAIWGDDAQYKVQYLDLSRIQEGILVREERFGYLEIAAHDKLDGRDFILCENNGDGGISVRLAVERTYDLNTGELRNS